MYIQILIADKLIYLQPWMHSVQDFCTEPAPVLAVYWDRLKSLSSWRSCILMLFVLPGTPPLVKRKILNFVHWCQSTVHEMLLMIHLNIKYKQ